MILYKEIVTLTNESIGEIVDKVMEAYNKASGKKAVSSAKNRLSVEEILINCMNCYSDNPQCLVSVVSSFGKIRFELKQRGPSRNPMEPDRNPDKESSYEFDNLILQSLGVTPRYNYIKGAVNHVVSFLDKKPSKNAFLVKMVAAIALSVAFFFILSLFPDVLGIAASITVPLFSKITAVITAVATPLVFLSVLKGIIGVEDISTFGHLSRKMLVEMLLTYILAAVLFATIGGIVYYSPGAESESGSTIIGNLTELVLDIVPGNLVEPFLTDNDLQVITVSIFIGVIMLIGKKLPSITKLCIEASDLVEAMMAAICKLLPLVVFLGIFNMLVSGNMRSVLKIYKMVIIFVVCCALIILILTLRVRKETGVPFNVIFKKQLPAFMITLTTCSQVAAMPENDTCFIKKFGIRKDFVDFSLPLCIVTYMPCGAVFLGLTAMSCGNIAGVPLSIISIVKVTIVAVIVAIAAPPIPGSAFAVMPIVFAACGVPDDVYPIAIIMGTVIGYFLPALNCYCLQLKILLAANKLEIVDHSILEKTFESEAS